MERLIEFVTGNIFVIVFVIGLLYSLFFRKSPLERPPAQRQRPSGQPPTRPASNRMPDFGGNPMLPNRQRRLANPPVRQESSPVERREPRPEYRPPEPPSPVERREPLPEPVYRTELPPANRTAPEPVFRSPLASRAQEENRDDLSSAASRPAYSAASAPIAGAHAVPADRRDDAAPLLRRDELTRAFVWAEVLGPPRAHRPFRKGN